MNPELILSALHNAIKNRVEKSNPDIPVSQLMDLELKVWANLLDKLEDLAFSGRTEDTKQEPRKPGRPKKSPVK